MTKERIEISENQPVEATQLLWCYLAALCAVAIADDMGGARYGELSGACMTISRYVHRLSDGQYAEMAHMIDRALREQASGEQSNGR